MLMFLWKNRKFWFYMKIQQKWEFTNFMTNPKSSASSRGRNFMEMHGIHEIWWTSMKFLKFREIHLNLVKSTIFSILEQNLWKLPRGENPREMQYP